MLTEGLVLMDFSDLCHQHCSAVVNHSFPPAVDCYSVRWECALCTYTIYDTAWTRVKKLCDMFIGFLCPILHFQGRTKLGRGYTFQYTENYSYFVCCFLDIFTQMKKCWGQDEIYKGIFCLLNIRDYSLQNKETIQYQIEICSIEKNLSIL